MCWETVLSLAMLEMLETRACLTAGPGCHLEDSRKHSSTNACLHPAVTDPLGWAKLLMLFYYLTKGWAFLSLGSLISGPRGDRVSRWSLVPHSHCFPSCSPYRLKGGEAHSWAHLFSCPPTLLVTVVGLMCYFRSRNITSLFKMSRLCMKHYIEEKRKPQPQGVLFTQVSTGYCVELQFSQDHTEKKTQRASPVRGEFFRVCWNPMGQIPNPHKRMMYTWILSTKFFQSPFFLCRKTQ